MCNITILDWNSIGRNQLLRLLIESCLLADNSHGFGYYLFNSKIYKRFPTSFYLLDHNIVPQRGLNGIYHLRRASFSNTTTAKENYKEVDTHPFNVGKFIVAHNGTLSTRLTHKDNIKIDKLISYSDIDSLRYAKVFEYYAHENGDIIDLEVIKKATNHFSGGFVLIHHLMGSKEVWISRGKDKTLYAGIISTLETQEPVGIIFNTLQLPLFSLLYMLDVYFPYRYNMDILELNENTTYTYTLGSYKLVESGKVLQDSPYETTIYQQPKPANDTFEKTILPVTKTKGNLFETFYETLLDSGLVFQDVNLLSNLILDKNFLFLDSIHELNKINAELLRAQKFINMRAKILAFRAIKEFTKRPYDKLQYPFFMNELREIKEVYNIIKEEAERNEHEVSISE